MTISNAAKFIAPARKVLSVLLVALLIFVPVLQINASAASLEDIVLIIWAAIKACGINLVGTTSSVVSFIMSELADYAAVANTTVTDIVYRLKYSVNSLGQFLINDSFVDFIDDFISFLTNKYNISDNQSKYLIEGSISLGDFISYSLPLRIDRVNMDLYSEWEVYLTPYDVYGIFTYKTANNHSSFVLAFWSTGHSYIKRIQGSSNNIYNTTQLELTETADNGIFWCRDTSISFDYNNYGGANYYVYDWDPVHTAFTELSDDDVVVQGDTVQSITTIINAPSGDIAFTAGDGAIINIGSDWGSNIYDLYDRIRRLIGDLSNQITIYYRSLQQIEQQVPAASDVQNLPAGTVFDVNFLFPDSNNNREGLQFGGIWHYVTQWIEDFSDGASIIWYCATSAPVPIVNTLYAVIVLTVVVGFIHKARSH